MDIPEMSLSEKAVYAYQLLLITDRTFEEPLKHALGYRKKSENGESTGRVFLTGSSTWREIAKLYHMFQKGEFSHPEELLGKYTLNLDDLDFMIEGGIDANYKFPEWKSKITDFGTLKYFFGGFTACFMTVEGLNVFKRENDDAPKTIEMYRKRTPTNTQSVTIDVTELVNGTPSSAAFSGDLLLESLITGRCRINDLHEAQFAAQQIKREWNVNDYGIYVANKAGLEFVSR